MPTRRRTYIHELDDWPKFRWSDTKLTNTLIRATRKQGEIVGNYFALAMLEDSQRTIDNLAKSAISSSRIEGEHPDPDSIRLSIRQQIEGQSRRAAQQEHHTPGIADVTTDASANYTQPLNEARLHQWHSWLFQDQNPRTITVGKWRDDQGGPMQVISSGPMGRNPVVHFEAPPAHRITHEMERFLNWFNKPDPAPDLRKPAIAHLWFITIHPYDDGNGRIARAVSDMALARCDQTPQRFYSMSAEILRQRQQYYEALESAQSGTMDITEWMNWYLQCLISAMEHGERTADQAVSRAKLQQLAAANSLNARQVKMITRLITGWEGDLTAEHYQRLCRCSRPTAMRDINRLIQIGILAINAPGGSSTSYRVQQLP